MLDGAMEGAVSDKRLAERVALVTGGSRGIGAAIAARLAEDGAKVVVNYLQSEVGAARVVEEIEAAGGHAIALRGDVSQVESASTLVSETLKRFGALDVLVNNAAINKAAPLDQVTEKSFDEHFAANVKSALFMSQGGGPRIHARGGHYQYQLAQLPLSERPPLQRHESGA